MTSKTAPHIFIFGTICVFLLDRILPKMKKIYLILCTLLSPIALMAQIALTAPNGDVLTNGSVTLTSFAEIFYPMDEPVKQRVTMTNTGSDTVYALVRRHMENIPQNAVAQFCWGPVCYMPEVQLAHDTIILAPGESDNSFYAYFFPEGNGGNYSIRYTFFDANNPADSSFLDIQYSITLDAPQLSSELACTHYPNPAKDFINMDIRIPGSASATLSMYNLTGGLVRETEVAAGKSQLKLDVSDLKPGVYFYTLKQNGKPLVTRRLVINR